MGRTTPSMDSLKIWSSAGCDPVSFVKTVMSTAYWAGRFSVLVSLCSMATILSAGKRQATKKAGRSKRCNGKSKSRDGS